MPSYQDLYLHMMYETSEAIEKLMKVQREFEELLLEYEDEEEVKQPPAETP